MSDLELIWDYQQAVSKQYELEQQMKQSENVKKLRELKTQIETLQNQIRDRVNRTNLQKKELRNIEDRLVVIKDKTKRANDELYGGKLASRELDAVEKSIKVLRGKAETEENNALCVMAELEQLDSQINNLKIQLEEKKEQFKKLNKSYADNKEILSTKLRELHLIQEELMNKIDPVALVAYRNFSARFPNQLGIALLENGICTGCHMGISFEKIKMSKNNLDNVTCDNCGRWLLFK